MGDENQYRPSVGQSGPKAQPDNRSEYAMRNSADYWAESVTQNPLNRLRLLDAKLARPNADVDSIKGRAAELIREIGAVKVLSDPDCVSLVRQLFGERGVARLRERAK